MRKLRFKLLRQIPLAILFVIALGPIIIFVSTMNLDRIIRGDVDGSDVWELFLAFVKVR